MRAKPVAHFQFVVVSCDFGNGGPVLMGAFHEIDYCRIDVIRVLGGEGRHQVEIPNRPWEVVMPYLYTEHKISWRSSVDGGGRGIGLGDDILGIGEGGEVERV